MLLARQAIDLSKASVAVIKSTREQAGQPGADLPSIHKDVLAAREAVANFVIKIARHPHLAILKPLFEDALEEWDGLEEDVHFALSLKDPELNEALGRLTDALSKSKGKFPDWRDTDLFQ